MIRVTGGTHRGRILKTPPGEITRPALSSVRMAVFNILSTRIIGSRFLDLFGGSGAYAIDAVSRGAESATIVDINRKAFFVIRENVTTLGLSEQIGLVNGDALKVIASMASRGENYDIIAVAPPHFAGLVDATMSKLDEFPEVATKNGTVFVQHHHDEPVKVALSNFEPGRVYTYGITRVSLFHRRVQ